MARQGLERVEPQADVARVAENTSRFRDRQRRVEAHESHRPVGGGPASVVFGSPAAARTARRIDRRRITEWRQGRRKRQGDAVADPLDGYLKFNFTFFSPGLVGRTSFTDSGVVPFSVSLPEEATRGPETDSRASALTWVGPSPQYQSSALALGETGGGARGPWLCVPASWWSCGPSQADKRYRVVNENSQVSWYEARSNVRPSAPRPQDAGIFRAYEPPPPGRGPARRRHAAKFLPVYAGIA